MNRNMRIREKHRSLFNKNIFYLFLLIPIFEPDIFKSFLLTDNIFIVLKFLVLLCVSYRYFTLLNVGRFSWVVILYCLILVFSTIINGQDVFYAIKKVIECVVVSMLLEIGIFYKGIKAIKILFEYLLFLIFVNVILFIPYPNGLLAANVDSENYKMFFLGIKNGMISWMVLAAFSGIICLKYYKSKKFINKYYLFLILATITIFYTKSTTGIIAWMLFLLYFFASKIYSFNFSLKKILPVLALLYIGIVFFRIQNYFEYIFEVFFNKGASLTGRVALWNYAIMYIKESPIIGSGIRESSLINIYGRSYTSHNFILELLLNGGVIQLIVFLIMLGMMVISIKKCQLRKLKSYMTVAFILFFIVTLVEAGVYRIHWFALWVIIYYSKKFGDMIKSSVIIRSENL